MEKEETATITISRKNRDRISSILKHDESFDFGISLLLAIFARPKLNAACMQAIHNRIVFPLITETEIEELQKRLLSEE